MASVMAQPQGDYLTLAVHIKSLEALAMLKAVEI